MLENLSYNNQILVFWLFIKAKKKNHIELASVELFVEIHIYWQPHSFSSKTTPALFQYTRPVLHPRKPLHTLQFLWQKPRLGLKQGGDKPHAVRNFRGDSVSTVSKGKCNVHLWSLMLKLVVQVGQIRNCTLDKNSVIWYNASCSR